MTSKCRYAVPFTICFWIALPSLAQGVHPRSAVCILCFYSPFTASDESSLLTIQCYAGAAGGSNDAACRAASDNDSLTMPLLLLLLLLLPCLRHAAGAVCCAAGGPGDAAC
jgi:hypothetical protein